MLSIVSLLLMDDRLYITFDNRSVDRLCEDNSFVARPKFFEWDKAGKIRGGEIFDEMEVASTSDQNKLKFCC